ncbi:MAG: hypothetical protein ACT4QD_19155 [Acidobacteriota bacterium]
MPDSPAAGAIGIAAGVIAGALAVVAALSVADAWPAVVLAAFGAALGAGVSINTIHARVLDGAQPTATALDPRAAAASRRLAVVHQLTIVLVVAAIVVAGVTENGWWWLAAAVAGAGWAAALFRLAGHLERHECPAGGSAYPRAFQLGLLAAALWLTYGAIAADTPWLWRPVRWDDFQGPIWAVVLEIAGLPLTLSALQRKPPQR